MKLTFTELRVVLSKIFTYMQKSLDDAVYCANKFKKWQFFMIQKQLADFN